MEGMHKYTTTEAGNLGLAQLGWDFASKGSGGGTLIYEGHVLAVKLIDGSVTVKADSHIGNDLGGGAIPLSAGLDWLISGDIIWGNFSKLRFESILPYDVAVLKGEPI